MSEFKVGDLVKYHGNPGKIISVMEHNCDHNNSM